jgi:hypothetical protein
MTFFNEYPRADLILVIESMKMHYDDPQRTTHAISELINLKYSCLVAKPATRFLDILLTLSKIPENVLTVMMFKPLPKCAQEL